MKIINKVITLSILVIALTSCNTFATRSTETLVASNSPVLAQTPKLTSVSIVIDRHNPESVLRAYFDAWNRSDWSAQQSFMDDKYAQMIPEPVTSLRILKLQSISPSSLAQHSYQVIFEITVKGQGVSMQSGQYNWSYYLTRDAKRDSWLISNYGAG